MNGIKAYWRETFKRGWNYRGLWRESLDDQPSAVFVYRGILIFYICLRVLEVCVNPFHSELVNGIRQPDPTFTFPSIGDWMSITLSFMIWLIVFGVLWHWGKIKNNRHIISVLMYLMLFLIGVLVAFNVGAFYIIFELRELDRFIYEAYGLRELYFYLTIPTLLVSPILVMWIQGWRQALIFSPILVLPFYIIMAFAGGPRNVFQSVLDYLK